MQNQFEPIAIVGYEGIFPNAVNSEELWQKTSNNEILLSNQAATHWQVDPKRIDKQTQLTSDPLWGGRGGYLPQLTLKNLPHEISQHPSYDLFKQFPENYHILFEVILKVLEQAKIDITKKSHAGIVLGTLQYTTHALNDFAADLWLKQNQLAMPAFISKQSAINRFMSGLPIHLISQMLNFSHAGFSLDAACASSLYALNYACQQLQLKKTDFMLAGGVQFSDNLYIHTGFAALQALSKKQQVMALRADADGLLPSEACGVLGLMRYTDAKAQGKKIHGIIRAIGLSNDGKGKGFLVPCNGGQQRAITAAYQQTDLTPQHISFIDCHATGTVVGDATEINSLAAFFNQPLYLGSLKTNVGHSLTASAIVSVIRTLKAFEHNTLPPATAVNDHPNPVLQKSPFKTLANKMEWATHAKQPRYAAISAFGFGGNNAHLVLQDTMEINPKIYVNKNQVDPIVIVDKEILLGEKNNDDFSMLIEQLAKNEPLQFAKHFTQIDLTLNNMLVTPNDLKQALPNQVLAVAMLNNLLKRLGALPQKTAVFMCASPDPEATPRQMLRTRLLYNLAQDIDISNYDSISPPLNSPRVMGQMANIHSNILNRIHDFQAQSATIVAEELSAFYALQIAADLLNNDAIDVAIVGAVETSNLVHQQALSEIMQQAECLDAAAMLVLTKQTKSATLFPNSTLTMLDYNLANTAAMNMPKDELYQKFIATYGSAHCVNGLLKLFMSL